MILATVSSLSANTNYLSGDVPALEDDMGIKIKIKIIIIIKKPKPKGVAEVSAFLMGKKGGKLGENELWAEAQIVKNSLNIKMADPDLDDMTLIVPDGIRVPWEIAEKLGHKSAFKISGGKIVMEGNKMGNFEIQD